MKYGFIGCGNMGGALALALSKATKDIILSDIDAEKAKNLAEELGVKYGNNSDVVKNSDCIFFGVKPQVIESMISGIKDELAEKKSTIITMAAGVTIESITECIGVSLPIIRIMPNTPVSVGSGLILYCTNSLVSDTIINEFKNDMRFAGIIDGISENLIDAGCSLSGCGPAFMYMFIEALADGGVACGLPREKAIKYAAQTMLGSADTVLKSGIHPEKLKDNVCSPAGSTIEGVKALEDAGLRAAGINAVTAAYKRNKELGKK